MCKVQLCARSGLGLVLQGVVEQDWRRVREASDKEQWAPCNNVHVGQLSANTSRVQPTPKEHYYTYSSNYSSSILFYEAKPTNHALMRKAHTVQLYIASIRFRT